MVSAHRVLRTAIARYFTNCGSVRVRFHRRHWPAVDVPFRKSKNRSRFGRTTNSTDPPLPVMAPNTVSVLVHMLCRSSDSGPWHKDFTVPSAANRLSACMTTLDRNSSPAVPTSGAGSLFRAETQSLTSIDRARGTVSSQYLAHGQNDGHSSANL